MLQQFDFKLNCWWYAHLVIGHRAHSVPCQAKALVASREKNNIQDTCETAGDTSANPGSTTERVQKYCFHSLFKNIADSTEVLYIYINNEITKHNHMSFFKTYNTKVPQTRTKLCSNHDGFWATTSKWQRIMSNWQGLTNKMFVNYQTGQCLLQEHLIKVAQMNDQYTCESTVVQIGWDKYGQIGEEVLSRDSKH